MDAAVNRSGLIGKEDPCWKTAGRLLDALHLSRRDHRIFQENIATYIANLKDEFVQSLQRKEDADLPRELTHAFAYEDMRWGEKLRRDIEKPYDDKAVFERLDSLDQELRDKIREVIASNHEKFPIKLYIAGSLVKGRFGANSDLDAMLVSDERCLKKAEECPGSEVQIQYLTGESEEWKNRFLASFGEKVSVDPKEVLENGHFLKDIYADVLQKKGYVFRETSPGMMKVWKIQKNIIRQEKAPPNSAGIAWSFADLPV